jgi:alkylation response protein AidB-like acyl-CoA dehydrogenase
VNKHTPEITEAERADILDKARNLAKEFDAIGRECDAANRFPTEMVPLYRNSGIAAAAVPRRYGGLGADIWTTSLIGRELAKGDPGIALSFNMHQAMVGIFRGTPALSEEARARVLCRVASEGTIICGPFSEARAGLAGLADTVAVPDPRGGWRITGKKNWSTLVEGADVIALNATITDADGKLPEDFREHAARESLFIIPADLENMPDARGDRDRRPHDRGDRAHRDRGPRDRRPATGPQGDVGPGQGGNDRGRDQRDGPGAAAGRRCRLPARERP